MQLAGHLQKGTMVAFLPSRDWLHFSILRTGSPGKCYPDLVLAAAACSMVLLSAAVGSVGSGSDVRAKYYENPVVDAPAPDPGEAV